MPIGNRCAIHFKVMVVSQAQPPSQLHLLLIALAPPWQLRFVPAQTLEFLSYDSPRLLFAALVAVPTLVAWPRSLHGRGQQFLAELFAAQTPAPPDLAITRRSLLSPPPPTPRSPQLTGNAKPNRPLPAGGISPRDAS